MNSFRFITSLVLIGAVAACAKNHTDKKAAPAEQAKSTVEEKAVNVESVKESPSLEKAQGIWEISSNKTQKGIYSIKGTRVTMYSWDADQRESFQKDILTLKKNADGLLEMKSTEQSGLILLVDSKISFLMQNSMSSAAKSISAKEASRLLLQARGNNSKAMLSVNLDIGSVPSWKKEIRTNQKSQSVRCIVNKSGELQVSIEKASNATVVFYFKDRKNNKLGRAELFASELEQVFPNKVSFVEFDDCVAKAESNKKNKDILVLSSISCNTHNARGIEAAWAANMRGTVSCPVKVSGDL